MEFFDTLCRVIFYFMIYSVVGWIYETTLCSITDRHFVNRGFLNGPYCPIYGSGALLDVLILGRIENPFLLFILGVLVTCSLEYLTSYVMEKLFKARWWDYSDKKFNRTVPPWLTPTFGSMVQKRSPSSLWRRS